jgi:hypothetical protein
MNDMAALLLACYFLPTLAAIFNNGASLSDKFAALILNVMFGWTIIGWFVVFCYATSDHKGRARVRQAQANFYLREEANAKR